MSSTYLTFTLGSLLLGIDVQNVQEILRDQIVTRVPRAAHGVVGLLNVRGQIITVIDGRLRFALPDDDRSRAASIDEGQVHLILCSGGESISLVVDAEGDVIEVEPDECEALPDTIGEQLRDLLVGSYRLDDALLLIADADRVAAVTTG